MGSFYGGGVIVNLNSGSGSNPGNNGTNCCNTNYDNLTNIPIINLTGVLPIDLSILEGGTYMIKGNYKYVADSDTITEMSPFMIRVIDNELAKTKYIRYDTIEDDEPVVKVITYDMSGDIPSYEIKSYRTQLITYNVTQSQLPVIGDPAMIYSTSEGVFVWLPEYGYKQLGTAPAAQQAWGEF